MTEPYSTAIWIARIQGLQGHLRIIARDCADSEDPHVQRLGRQALAGVAEAERYILDKEWSDDEE